MKQSQYLELALKIAETSDCANKHGAVIVKGGRVLAVGLNKFRNCPKVTPSDKPPGEKGTVFATHAEIDALSRVRDARGAVIYVARAGFDGKPRMSRPCNRCAPELVLAGVKMFIYTVGA